MLLPKLEKREERKRKLRQLKEEGRERSIAILSGLSAKNTNSILYNDKILERKLVKNLSEVSAWWSNLEVKFATCKHQNPI